MVRGSLDTVGVKDRKQVRLEVRRQSTEKKLKFSPEVWFKRPIVEALHLFFRMV